MGWGVGVELVLIWCGVGSVLLGSRADFGVADRSAPGFFAGGFRHLKTCTWYIGMSRQRNSLGLLFILHAFLSTWCMVTFQRPACTFLEVEYVELL